MGKSIVCLSNYNFKRSIVTVKIWPGKSRKFTLDEYNDFAQIMKLKKKSDAYLFLCLLRIMVIKKFCTIQLAFFYF